VAAYRSFWSFTHLRLSNLFSFLTIVSILNGEHPQPLVPLAQCAGYELKHNNLAIHNPVQSQSRMFCKRALAGFTTSGHDGNSFVSSP
jgi:hypothetical protein